MIPNGRAERDAHKVRRHSIFVFMTVLLVGVPVFIALAGSSLIYTHFIAIFRTS